MDTLRFATISAEQFAAPQHITEDKWRMVRQLNAKVVVTGGLSRKEHLVDSITVLVGGESKVFVKVSLSEEWFQKVAGGPTTNKSLMKPVTVLKMLAALVSNEDEEGPDAVADIPLPAEDLTAVAGVDARDPMLELDSVHGDDAPKPKRRKTIKQGVVYVQAPARPGKLSSPPHRVSVAILKTKKDFYVRIDHLGWLAAYAADEIATQGVDALNDPNESGKKPNVDDVPYLCVEWCFAKNVWEAEFLAGPFKGTKRRVSPKCVIFVQKWELLRKEQIAPDVPYSDLAATVCAIGKK